MSVHRQAAYLREESPPTLALANLGKEASVKEIVMVHGLAFLPLWVSEMIPELVPHLFLSLVHSLDCLHLIHAVVPLLMHQQAWLHVGMHCLGIYYIISSTSRECTVATHTHHLAVRLEWALWMIPTSSRSRCCVALRHIASNSSLIVSIYVRVV